MQQQNKPQPASGGSKYRFFADPGHGWLEVPRREVMASGAKISGYSYYDPVTDMAYLEEDCDIPAFLAAAGLGREVPTVTVASSMPRRLAAYDMDAFIDSHISVVRPDNGGRA